MARKLPPAGQKCERKVEAKSHFHAKSFRWTHHGDSHVMVACPKTVERMGRVVKTRWVERGAPRQQCRLASRPGKVSLRVHAIVMPAKRGQCRRSYRKA